MERCGMYYKLYSMTINGVKLYFIGRIKDGGYRWVYRNSEDAVDRFEALERHAEKYVCDLPNWEE